MELLDECAKAAHEAWMAEKVKRLEALGLPQTWLAENGDEQLVHWDMLSEPIRDFDRIVVGAIMETMTEKGLVGPQPGVMHPIDQAFYDQAILDRDFYKYLALGSK